MKYLIFVFLIAGIFGGWIFFIKEAILTLMGYLFSSLEKVVMERQK